MIFSPEFRTLKLGFKENWVFETWALKVVKKRKINCGRKDLLIKQIFIFKMWI